MAPSRWDDDSGGADEYDDDYDEELGDDESSELVSCPGCGAEIHEESEQCPVCLSYITHPTSIWYGRPWWWLALGALGIIGVILALALNR
jgi:hypothetical protein